MEKYLIGSHIEAYPYEEDKLNIFNKNTGKTFVLGDKESQVFQLMNGANTVEDIHNRCPFYTAEEIMKLANAFAEIGLFEKKKNRFNPFKIKLRLFNPNSFFAEDASVTKVLHYMICVGAPVLFLIAFFAMRLLNPDPVQYMGASLSAFSTINLVDIVVIALLSLVCLALHEFGHMITARRYGVNVPEIGVMLYFLIPCAYTNITGINLLKNKGKRLVVLLSGTLVNIGLIGVCYLVMALCSSPVVGMYCLALIIVNLGTIFMNTMVLIKFDGYYVMETILDEPKLRENAIEHIVNLFKITVSRNKEAKVAFKETVKNDSAMLMHITYCVYAVLSVSYVPFIMLNTVIPFFF